MATASNLATKQKLASERSFKAGETIIAQGQPISRVYTVQSGSVDFLRIIDGKESVIATHMKGSVFGGTEGDPNAPRDIFVRASNDVELLISKPGGTSKGKKSGPPKLKYMKGSDVASRQVFGRGEIIFSMGSVGNCAYFIESGEVEIFQTVDKIDYTLATHKAGALIGEMALIDDQPRMASARASKGAVLIVVNRTTLESRLAEADPFISKILRIFAKNIRAHAIDLVISQSKLNQLIADHDFVPGGVENTAEDKVRDADYRIGVTDRMVEVGLEALDSWNQDKIQQAKPEALKNLIGHIYTVMECARRSII